VRAAIDEIDKAPRDFPTTCSRNSPWCFDHPFPPDAPSPAGPPAAPRRHHQQRRARLPDPFLRRCIVHHIELTETLLTDILGAWADAFAARLPPPVQAQAWRGSWMSAAAWSGAAARRARRNS